MQALFIRIPAPGCHYTLSSFATMGAFLSPPRPPLFPTESLRASFFVDTFNKTSQLLPWLIIESEGQCHVLRYKGQSSASISFTCRTMTVKFQRIPLGKGSFWHSDYQDLIQERLPALTHTYPNIYKTFEIRLIHQRDIRAGQRACAASSLRFPQFALCCFCVNLFCFCSVILLSTSYSSAVADLFCTVLQCDDRHVFSWAAEQGREQSRIESQVVSLSKMDPSWHWGAYVVHTEAKFVHCQILRRTVTHS